MKLHILSDLHTEFAEFVPPETDAEAVILACAAGDIHGAMDRLYDDILAFEKALGVRFDYVLHVGDFGVWPDSNRIDKAARMCHTMRNTRPDQHQFGSRRKLEQHAPVTD